MYQLKYLQMKDNIYKKITRVIIILFLLFCVFSLKFYDQFDSWLMIPMVIGILILMGSFVFILYFSVAIICFGIIELVNWSFNRKIL